MLAAIDRWRKNMGGESRADAIRTLIRIGLVAGDVSLFKISGALDAPVKTEKKRASGPKWQFVVYNE